MDPVPMQGDGDVALYVADCSPLAMQSDGAGDEWVLGFPAHGQALRSQLTETKAQVCGPVFAITIPPRDHRETQSNYVSHQLSVYILQVVRH